MAREELDERLEQETTADGAVDDARAQTPDTTRAPESGEGGEPAADDGAGAEQGAGGADASTAAAGEADGAAGGSAGSPVRPAADGAVRAAGTGAHSRGELPKRGAPKVGLPVVIVLLVVVAIAAALAGYFLAGGSNAAGKAKLTEAELDNVVASYTYNGAKHDVTARQAIESQYGVESMKDADGMYAAPSAETVLSCVRNEILCADAAAQGVEVDDDALATYAQGTLGTTDFESIASMYGVSEDQARAIVRTSATVQALNAKVTEGAATMPSPPEEGKGKKSYGSYIAKLLGAEWNAKKDAWAADDGELHALLEGTEFSTKSATYDQALAVYQAAYSVYSSNANNERQSWNNYVNDLFANASMDLHGLLL